MYAKWLIVVAAAATFAAGAARAATLLDTASVVAATPSADALQPRTVSFQASAAGSYILRLEDLGDPEALGALRAVVVRDQQIIADVELTYAGSGAARRPRPTRSIRLPARTTCW